MQAPRVSRRILLSALFPSVAAGREQPLREWLLGRWQADGEKTAASLSFQGKPLNDEQRARASKEFGKMFYAISRQTFTVGGFVPGDSKSFPYKVFSETSSSITLEFPATTASSTLTLYKESEDCLFIRTGVNLEYLRRSGAA